MAVRKRGQQRIFRGARYRRRPGALGGLLAFTALAFLSLSPYFCQAFQPRAAAVPAIATAAENPAGEAASAGGAPLAEVVALFGRGLAYCGLLPTEGGADATPPELFCLACQLTAAGAPLLPEPPVLPRLEPAGERADFTVAEAAIARAPWTRRAGPTRAPPIL